MCPQGSPGLDKSCSAVGWSQRITATACAHQFNTQKSWWQRKRFRKGRVSRGETPGGTFFEISSGGLNIQWKGAAISTGETGSASIQRTLRSMDLGFLQRTPQFASCESTFPQWESANQDLTLHQKTLEPNATLCRVLLLLEKIMKLYNNKIRQKMGVQEFNLYVEIINNLLHIKIVRKVNSYHMHKERNYNY